MPDPSLIAKLVPTLFENQHLLVVSKPAGIDVGGRSPLKPGVAGGQPEPHPDFQSGLLELLNEVRSSAGSARLNAASPDGPLLVVNRLSRFESGVLILAKSPAVAAALRADWKNGRIQQEYLAVVLGRAERQLQIGGPIAAEAARERGGRKRSGRSTDRRRPLKPPVAKRTLDPARSTETSVSLVDYGDRRSLVSCRTTAPTTHVLRAQLRAVRLRVLGDHLNDDSPRPTPVENTFLHLARVRIKLPGRSSGPSSGGVAHLGATSTTSTGRSSPTAASVARLIPASAGGKPIFFQCDPPPNVHVYLTRERDVVRFLHAGLVRRLPLLGNAATDSYRLLTGGAEGLRGLVVEKFADTVILQVHEDKLAESKLLEEIARWYRAMLGPRSIYARSYLRKPSPSDRPATPGLSGLRPRPASPIREDRPVLGKRIAGEIVIRENGLSFAIRLSAGQSVGLFLDQRDNRRRIREISSGKDVLNLFAYTCGFSVAAAAGGARLTASVDVSPKHLEWGRHNFELNGIDMSSPVAPDGPPAHQFFKSDAAEFLQRARRQGREFDVIVIDAPSFAHARGRSAKSGFSIATDLPGLVRGCSAVLRPGGVLMVSTNYRKLTASGLRMAIREGAGGRKFSVESIPPLPIDFACDPDHAKTLFASFD